MFNAHALAQYLGCPFFELAVMSALVRYCTVHSSPYASIVWAFHVPRSCDSVFQLLVDVYCLHATKGAEQDEFSGTDSSFSEAEAFFTFHIRIKQKLVEALQLKGLKELDPKDYQRDVPEGRTRRGQVSSIGGRSEVVNSAGWTCRRQERMQMYFDCKIFSLLVSYTCIPL